MNLPFLFGVLSAWAVAQVGLGLFFVLAHVFSRREPEYLPFAMLCFVLAVTTTGLAWAHAIRIPEDWILPATLTHAGAIASGAVNLHFVMRYAGVAQAGRFALGIYGLGLLEGLVLLAGGWWTPGSLIVRHGMLFDTELVHVSAQPTLLGIAGYAVSIGALLASQVLLIRAYRAGKREALFACIGGGFVVLVAANDILLVTGRVANTVYLLPHGFMMYAAGFATTLLFRYRVAAGELAQVESTLRETTEELRQSHVELRVLQDELIRKQQLAAVGELAAAIAHEVRNPLAIIVNAIASLRRRGIREEDRQMLLGIVDEETARLNRLVSDLLRYARPVNVNRANVVLSELAQRTQSVARDHPVNVVVEPEAPAQIPADANLLTIALDNLVENACSAVAAGAGVEIVVGSGELDGAPCARLQVRDDGHGMDRDVLGRAMDPFFTTRPSGTGLGLPIVQRIAEAHGGRLELDSEPGRGTTVTMLLPLDEDAHSASRSA
jgi:signal transduction histidine kinase